MDCQEIISAEAKRVAKTTLASRPIENELSSRIKAVKVPSSYSPRFKLELTKDSPELKLRLDCLRKFNDRWEKSVDARSKTEYFKELEGFLFQQANEVTNSRSSRESQEKLEDCGHNFEEDVFLRTTITKAVVLRKFDEFVWVFTVKGEEFLVKVKEDWPGLGYDVAVGDVLRVFKPKKTQDGRLIHFSELVW